MTHALAVQAARRTRHRSNLSERFVIERARKRRFVLVALACAVPGCHPRDPPRLPTSGLVPAAASSHDVQVVRTSPSIVAYSGPLTDEGLTKLQQATGDEVRTLRIRSGGGRVTTGMSFGEWIRDRHLDVEVVDYCASSCANYVFTAARRKTVLPGGVVAWHGDAHQELPHADLERLARDGRTDAIRRFLSDRARETAFFESIRVDECLCRIGDEHLGAHGFYTLAPADLARFGVNGIVAAPNGAEDIDAAMRGWLRLRFVELPPNLDLRGACAQTGHTPASAFAADAR